MTSFDKFANRPEDGSGVTDEPAKAPILKKPPKPMSAREAKAAMEMREMTEQRARADDPEQRAIVVGKIAGYMREYGGDYDVTPKRGWETDLSLEELQQWLAYCRTHRRSAVEKTKSFIWTGLKHAVRASSSTVASLSGHVVDVTNIADDMELEKEMWEDEVRDLSIEYGHYLTSMSVIKRVFLRLAEQVAKTDFMNKHPEEREKLIAAKTTPVSDEMRERMSEFD